MAENILGYEDLHVFLKDLKLETGKRPTNIKGAKSGRFTQPEIIQDAYLMDGGANLSFTKKGALRILGGVAKVRASKEKLDQFRETAELSEEESKMYAYLSEQLGEYITRKEQYAERRREKPAEEKPAEEKPAEEKPAEEKPAEEKPAEEKPAEEKPAEEKPAEEKTKNPREEKGNNIMDLKDVNGLEDVKKQMEAFTVEQERINGKEELDKIDADMRRLADEIRRKEFHLAKYEEELNNLNTNSMDHVESRRAVADLKETIKLVHEGHTNEFKNGEGKTVTVVEKGLDALKEEMEALKKQREDVENGKNNPDKTKETNALRDKRSAFYTQAQIKFDNEIRKIKHQMEGILISLNEFQYEYQEGTRIPTNGDAVKKLNEEYHGLQDRLKDVQAAKALCEEQKAIVKAEWDESVKKINEIISRKEEKPVEEKPAEEKPAEEKPAEEKPAEEKPAEEKPAEEKPAEEKPAEEKPAEEKPAEEKPAEEKPAEEKPAEEKPAEEKPAEKKKKEDELPIIDGEALYRGLNFMQKYYLKVEAYRIDNPDKLDEDGEPSIFQKIRLMLPSAKYKTKAERGITLGRIDPNEVFGYDEEIDEDIEFEEVEEDFDSRYAVDEQPDPNKKARTKNPSRSDRSHDEK